MRVLIDKRENMRSPHFSATYFFVLSMYFIINIIKKRFLDWVLGGGWIMLCFLGWAIWEGRRGHQNTWGQVRD